MLKNVVPTGLVGIKRLAKQIKAERSIPLHEAQDIAAQRAGYENLRHAQNALDGAGLAAAPKPSHRTFITAYWKDRKSGAKGRETLAIMLSCPWANLVKPVQLKLHRSLDDFRGEGSDHLARTDLLDGQSAARRAVCGAARGLLFMDATKLRPSKGHSRAYPGGSSMNSIPGRDHESVWYDPVTKGYVLVDEPYDASAQSKASERMAWAQRHDYDLVKPAWPGMYAPDLGSRIYLASPRAAGVPLADLVAALDSLPEPPMETSWTGESAPFAPVFISPDAPSRTLAEPAAVKPLAARKPAAPRNTVGYVMSFVGPQRRPSMRMPLEAHSRVGALLKSVLVATANRPGVHNRVNSVRSELDEWVQREYSRSELPSEQFIDLYYRETGISLARSLPEADRMHHCRSLDAVRQALVEHYADCAPLRGVLKKLDLAQQSLMTWT